VQSDEEILQAIDDALQNSSAPDTVNKEGHTISAYIPPYHPVTKCCIVFDGQVYTVYPMAMDGIVHEVKVVGFDEWANGIEGQAIGTIGDAVLAFFDTRYYRNIRAYRREERYPFALTAFAYTLSPAKEQMVKGPDGALHSTIGIAGYRRFERGDIDDFVFQSPVKDVQRVSYSGRTLYRLILPLFRLQSDDGEGYHDLDIVVYAAEHVTGGYVPKPGDAVTGVLWLQGYLSDEQQ